MHASIRREVIHDAALLAALDKLLRFVVIIPCVYVTVYIEHHVGDHISWDGQCFLFVRSLAGDHPSNTTNDRVRWNFLPRG